MTTLSEMSQRETDLPADADAADVLRLADEVRAFGIGERNVESVTPILVRLARRLYSNVSTHTEAVAVLELASAGLFASEMTRKRDEAYQAAYVRVREAVAAGMTEVDAARISGLDRMTVRKAVGKPRRRKQQAANLTIVEELDFDYDESDEESEFDLALAESAERPAF